VSFSPSLAFYFCVCLSLTRLSFVLFRCFFLLLSLSFSLGFLPLLFLSHPLVSTAWQHATTHRNTLYYTATRCNTLQYIATHCNTLHRTAIHCNALPYKTQPASRIHATPPTLILLFLASSRNFTVIPISTWMYLVCVCVFVVCVCACEQGYVCSCGFRVNVYFCLYLFVCARTIVFFSWV